MQFYQHLSAHTHDILVTTADIKSFKAELDKTDAFPRTDENLFARLRDSHLRFKHGGILQTAGPNDTTDDLEI